MKVKKKVKGRNHKVKSPVASELKKEETPVVNQEIPVSVPVMSDEEIASFMNSHSKRLTSGVPFEKIIAKDETTETYKIDGYTVDEFVSKDGSPDIGKTYLNEIYTPEFTKIIEFFDFDNRLEHAFMVLYNMNALTLIPYAIDKFMNNIEYYREKFETSQYSDIKESVFVSTIQYMSMLGVLGSRYMKGENNILKFNSDIDGYVDLLNFMDSISNTNCVDYRMIQKMLADGLDWEILSYIVDIAVQDDGNDGIEPDQVVIMNNMMIALDRLITSQDVSEDDLPKINAAISDMFKSIKNRAKYMEIDIRVKLGCMSAGMFVVLFNAMLNYSIEEIEEVFGFKQSNAKFEDYLDWMMVAVKSAAKQPEEVKLIQDTFGIDVITFFSQISLMSDMVTNYPDILNPEVRDVIFALPMRWTLMMFDKLKYPVICTVAENLTTMGLAGLQLLDMDTEFTARVKSQNGDIVHSVDVRNSDVCCRLAAEEQMRSQGNTFYGQLVF